MSSSKRATNKRSASKPTQVSPSSSSLPKSEKPCLKPADAPVLLHDGRGNLIAGIKLEEVTVTGSSLKLSGWTLGFPRIALLCDTKRVSGEFRRVPRPDVLQALDTRSSFEPGFELTIHELPAGNFELRWYVTTGSGAVDFALEIELPAQEAKSPVQDKYGAANGHWEAGAADAVHEVEAAIKVKGGFVVLGWHDDRRQELEEIVIHKNKGDALRFPLFASGTAQNVQRVYRPEVCSRLNIPSTEFPAFGVVARLPVDDNDTDELIIGFERTRDRAIRLPVSQPGDYDSDLEAMLEYSGQALFGLAERHDDESLLSWLEDHGHGSQLSDASPAIAVDHAYVLAGRTLILNGWVAVADVDITNVTLMHGDTAINLTSSMQRVHRPDLFAGFSALHGESLGFIGVVHDVSFRKLQRMKLVVRTGDARYAIRFTAASSDLKAIFGLLADIPYLVEPVRKLAEDSAVLNVIPGWREQFAAFIRTNFLRRFNSLPVHVDDANAVVAAVDRVYALDDAGLLIYGWCFYPAEKPLSVDVIDANGNSADVSGRNFPLYRSDVFESLRTRFPQVGERCGFICLAELPTKPGEERVLRFRFTGNKNVWLKLASTKSMVDPLQQVKDMLGLVPAPDRIRSDLYRLFDTVLGKPVEHVYRRRTATVLETSEKQFGSVPAKSEVSVIVPLYGRHDFMRHQLAHFAGDSEFDNCDLMYVVDDPSILDATLDSAAYCYDLFGKPFRVLWYGANLGFAGANNVGVKHARSPFVLLLNSDVLPQSHGWLGQLQQALMTLPKCGAVGPLLEFGDGSIQHAGMQTHSDPMLPGFLLNTHASKGLRWSGGDEARQVPMLTAACVMLRKANYEAAGGLDEGYIVGDFEDSDLCLKLRKQGKHTWLVPGVRLWHLERQSQNLNNVAGVRQLLTLFNGWRYQQKILNGDIADPRVGG